MKYESAGAFRAALEQRLKNDAASGGPSIQRARKRVCFERLLARLEAVAPGQWLVKGGFALELRLGQGARATKDIDIDWHDSEREAAETLLVASAADLGDFFDFQIERAGTDPDIGGRGLRYRAAASVAGRIFEQVTVDVGFAPVLVMSPERLETSGALAFADIEPVRVPAAPLEQHLAEKLHAYSRTYGDEQPSSRPKDLIDIVLIAGLARFDAGRLREVINAVFSTRATHAVPSALEAPPDDWGVPYRTLALEIGLESAITLGFEAARRFLDPILLGGSLVRGTWDPGERRWR